jgi:hypothetical protein
MSSSREEKAKELYSTRPRELPKAPPIITIDTTVSTLYPKQRLTQNKNLGATPFGNSTLGSDLPARQSSSILDQSPYANQDSTLTHMFGLRITKLTDLGMYSEYRLSVNTNAQTPALPEEATCRDGPVGHLVLPQTCTGPTLAI